jgi:hypothetical protein
MAEISSLEAAKVAANTKLRNDEALGRVHVVSISAPLAAAATAWAENDTIASPVDLPKGTRILGFNVFHEAMGTSVTMDIGLRKSATVDPAQTVVDADGIAADLDVAAAGVKSHLTAVANTGEYIDVSATQAIKRLDDVCNIYASLLDANPDDGQVFRIDVYVALPG